MSHTPFILAAYLITTAVLLWVALAPVVSNRNLVRRLKIRQLQRSQKQREETQ